MSFGDGRLRLEYFAEFEGRPRLAERIGSLMRLPPRDIPSTHLASREKPSFILRTNAKLFYTRQQEVSGEVDAALAQLASFGLAVTERHPISHYVSTESANKAALRPDALHAGDGHETINERRPVYFGDRVILRLVPTVRPARLPEERPLIDAIHAAAFEDSHRRLLGGHDPWFAPCGACFVVDVPNRHPCGFIYIVTREDEVEADAEVEEPPIPRVDDLFVHPDAQGRGVGAALLAHAEAFVAPATLHLCVLEADERARRFYRRHGWTEASRFVCSIDGGVYLHASKVCGVET